MSLATTDVCDAHEARLHDGSLQVLAPLFQAYGLHTQFAGPAVTLQLFEENALVRAQLEQPGKGQVLVIDGGGSTRTALVGGNLAKLAEQNGWAGIIVYGAVRDRSEIEDCAIGVRALGTCPVKSAKTQHGQMQVIVRFAGVRIEPGDWIYADADGVLVSRVALHV